MQAKILIADDDGDMSEALEALLRLQGYFVTVTHNGLDALRLLRQGETNILLTDVDMPIMNGIELIARARKESTTLPIVAITGQDEDIIDARKAGANAYIRKQFIDWGSVSKLLKQLIPPIFSPVIT